LALATVCVLGCVPSGTAPLADMLNKRLAVNGLAEGGGDLAVTLIADGCPLLNRAAVEATLNGLPMMIDPGRPGNELDPSCHAPVFRMSPLPADLGSTLTIVIKDNTETLRVVISGFHSHSPALEAPPAAPIAVHRGDAISFSFSGASRDDPPDSFGARFDVDGTPTGGPPCSYSETAMPTIAGGHIDVVVPSTLCFTQVGLFTCIGFIDQPALTTCENAACDFNFIGDQCARYPLLVQP
jgi:hypothetical protein